MLFISSVLASTLLIQFAVQEVPMPNPTDYIGQRIVEFDVPDELTVNLLLDAGIDGLACRPAPGHGPWIVTQEDEALIRSLGLKGRDIVPNLSIFIANRNAERRATRGSLQGGVFYSDFRVLDEYFDHMDQFLIDQCDSADLLQI